MSDSSAALNNTVVATINELPVYGLPGYGFYVTHSLTVIVLNTSAMISFGVLVKLKPYKKFFARNIGDRLVIYLAMNDLVYSLSMMSDQVYMLAIQDHVPKLPCVLFASLNLNFALSQINLVIFAAMNAFVLVVVKKKLDTGRYDWRLLSSVMLPPAVTCVTLNILGYLGPSGAWCWLNGAKGHRMDIIAATLTIVTFLLNIIFYTGIWVKLRQVAQQQNGSTKYTRTARTMTMFVAAFILQWWAAAIYSIWKAVGEPHIVIVTIALVFNSAGGIFNFFAYTLIRKKQMQIESSGDNTNTD